MLTAFLYAACFLMIGFAVAEWIMRKAVVASAERIARDHSPSN